MIEARQTSVAKPGAVVSLSPTVAEPARATAESDGVRMQSGALVVADRPSLPVATGPVALTVGEIARNYERYREWASNANSVTGYGDGPQLLALLTIPEVTKSQPKGSADEVALIRGVLAQHESLDTTRAQNATQAIADLHAALLELSAATDEVEAHSKRSVFARNWGAGGRSRRAADVRLDRAFRDARSKGGLAWRATHELDYALTTYEQSVPGLPLHAVADALDSVQRNRAQVKGLHGVVARLKGVLEGQSTAMISFANQGDTLKAEAVLTDPTFVTRFEGAQMQLETLQSAMKDSRFGESLATLTLETPTVDKEITSRLKQASSWIKQGVTRCDEVLTTLGGVLSELEAEEAHLHREHERLGEVQSAVIRSTALAQSSS